MYNRFERLYQDRNEEAPLCDKCTREMSPDPDVEIDDETGCPYVTAYHFICRNRNCPEPTEP